MLPDNSWKQLMANLYKLEKQKSAQKVFEWRAPHFNRLIPEFELQVSTTLNHSQSHLSRTLYYSPFVNMSYTLTQPLSDSSHRYLLDAYWLPSTVSDKEPEVFFPLWGLWNLWQNITIVPIKPPTRTLKQSWWWHGQGEKHGDKDDMQCPLPLGLEPRNEESEVGM